MTERQIISIISTNLLKICAARGADGRVRTLKDLLIYLKHYKKESFFAPLFKLLEATFELIVPLVVARIIDSGIRPGNKAVI